MKTNSFFPKRIIHPLPDSLQGRGDTKGFIFKKIHENDSGYIYEINSGSGTPYYECFMKQTVPICLDFDKRIYSDTEFKEKYPKSKDFGKTAWTFMSLEKAKSKLKSIQDKFDKIIEKENHEN